MGNDNYNGLVSAKVLNMQFFYGICSLCAAKNVIPQTIFKYVIPQKTFNKPVCGLLFEIHENPSKSPYRVLFTSVIKTVFNWLIQLL